MGRFMILIFII